MVYLNNAATSYPKPDCVIDAVTNCLAGLPAGQFRSTQGGESGDLLAACREALAPLLGVADAQNIFFTSGATEAANAVINGIQWRTGRVVFTAAEHNSVLRPLYNHRPALTLCKAACDAHGYVDEESLREAVGEGCDAVFVNHVSNVTGAVQDLAALGRIAKKAGALFVVDASQSAGCMPVEADRHGVDILLFTGHKSLLGPQGTGGFYAREPQHLRPYKYGGTGADSAKLLYALDGDQELEPGTQNAPGIAGLTAGAQYVAAQGVDTILEAEGALAEYLAEGLSNIPGVTVYCGKKGRQGPVLSFAVAGLVPGDVAYILQSAYGITLRAGLHCAPLVHEYIGAGARGTVRASFSPFTTHGELDALLNAVRDIAAGAAGGEAL